MTPPFERTSCACSRCVACCERPAHLGPGDAARIAAHLGCTEHELLAVLRPGRGALVADTRTGKARRILTVVPATLRGRCVFQRITGMCEIHAVSPFGCRYFDLHMDFGEAHRRSAWGLEAIEADPEYAELRRAVEARHQ